jgi:hypothetical protein
MQTECTIGTLHPWPECYRIMIRNTSFKLNTNDRSSYSNLTKCWYWRDKMPYRTFDFCALQFLNQWIEKESKYCVGLTSKDEETQRRTLISAGGHFRVARNLPKKYEIEKNIGRYQPIIDALNVLPDINRSNVIAITYDVHEKISSGYDQRNALSLTTKFLWLKTKHPVRIYDSQVRSILKTPIGNLESFNSVFSDQYFAYQEQIEGSCDNLKKVISYSAEPNMPIKILEDLTSSIWFRERVLDIYLWNLGK